MQATQSPCATSGRSPSSGLLPPVISSDTHGWKTILIEEFHQPPGEETYHSATRHTLCLALNSRPSRLFQRMGDRYHTSLVTKGDLTITPAQFQLRSQWAHDDHYLRIQIAANFLEDIAQHHLEQRSKPLELLPEFKVRNPQIEQICMMLLAELQGGGVAGQLYVESLTTALAVHLLREYSTMQTCAALCDAWLTNAQLLLVTDYISDRLAEPIQLSDLAALLGLSQFHFSRLFKNTTGVPPYQYVLQQRVERAKQLLKTTHLSVMEIALQCGFSSHSHLGKWFRQYTGVTPKVFRLQTK